MARLGAGGQLLLLCSRDAPDLVPETLWCQGLEELGLLSAEPAPSTELVRGGWVTLRTNSLELRSCSLPEREGRGTFFGDNWG